MQQGARSLPRKLCVPWAASLFLIILLILPTAAMSEGRALAYLGGGGGGGGDDHDARIGQQQKMYT